MIFIKVNVTLLNENLNRMNRSIDKYTDTYLNLYNQLRNSHDNANSEKISLFYDSIENEKVSNQKFLNEMNEIKKIYKFIHDNYKPIGNDIQFDLSRQTELLDKFDQIKKKIKSMKDINNTLQAYNYTPITSLVSSDALLLEKLNKDIETIEKDMKKSLGNIETIERDTKALINNLNVSVINETDIREFI